MTSAILLLTIGMVAGVLAYRMPSLTRPDLFFAVTVAADFAASPPGRQILRRYHAWVLVNSLVGIGMASALARSSASGPLLGLLVQSLGCFAAYYHARARVMPFAVAPTTVREAGLTPRATQLPGGWILQLLPFAALAATGLYIRSRWAELPGRFPLHWGLDGQPDRWASRSNAAVFAPLLTSAAVLASMALMAWLLAGQSRQIRSSGAAGAAEHKFRRTVLGVVLAGEYLLALVSAWTSLLPLAAGPSGATGRAVMLAPLLASLLFVVCVAVILVRMGQGGSRLLPTASEAPSQPGGAPIGDRSLDRYWKAGVFYVNPNDPAIFVEKRFGIGYTINFGRPAAWAFFAAIVLVPIVVAWLLEHAG